jgi:pimeloyl-ACP methyl ester carboxylesterase
VNEISVAGGTIRSLEKGDGPTVVVLHHSFGNPGWLTFHEKLAERVRVIVPDLPGFGASDRPDWARHPRDLALLMRHWLRKIGPPRAIVGLGFGGWVTAELLTMAPEITDRAVLVGAAGLLPQEGRILDQMLISHGAYVKSAFRDQGAYASVYGETFEDATLLDWDINREMIVRIAWKPYMYNRQMAPLLTEVETPTLLVWGEYDAVVPMECARQYQALLPNARLEVVPGSGHAVDMEAPDQLAQLVLNHIA